MFENAYGFQLARTTASRHIYAWIINKQAYTWKASVTGA